MVAEAHQDRGAVRAAEAKAALKAAAKVDAMRLKAARTAAKAEASAIEAAVAARKKATPPPSLPDASFRIMNTAPHAALVSCSMLDPAEFRSCLGVPRHSRRLLSTPPLPIPSITTKSRPDSLRLISPWLK